MADEAWLQRAGGRFIEEHHVTLPGEGDKTHSNSENTYLRQGAELKVVDFERVFFFLRGVFTG